MSVPQEVYWTLTLDWLEGPGLVIISGCTNTNSACLDTKTCLQILCINPPKKSSQKSSPPTARAQVLYLGPKQRLLGGTPWSLSLTGVDQRQHPPRFFHPFSPKRILLRAKRYFVSSNGLLSLRQPWLYHKRLTYFLVSLSQTNGHLLPLHEHYSEVVQV